MTDRTHFLPIKAFSWFSDFGRWFIRLFHQEGQRC